MARRTRCRSTSFVLAQAGRRSQFPAPGVPPPPCLPPSPPNPQSPVPVACTFPAHAPAHPESQCVRTRFLPSLLPSLCGRSVRHMGKYRTQARPFITRCTCAGQQIADPCIVCGTYLPPKKSHEIHWYKCRTVQCPSQKGESRYSHLPSCFLFKNSSHPRPHLNLLLHLACVYSVVVYY